MPPLSSRSFSLSRSRLPIARRDDTLPAGDKGSRARGRAKLEMLIPDIPARETGDGRGEAGVSYETVLILSFIPTRISEPETGEESVGIANDATVAMARDACCCYFYCCCCCCRCNWLHATSSVMKHAGCAIRSVNASRKKRLSRDHGVKLLFARRRSSSSDDCKTRMMNL